MSFGSSMPAIFAHRGASSEAPENTLKAFKLALQQQADGIELDVHLSAEGQVVVIHDNELQRTTNGIGRVDEMPLEELRQLDAGEGERIPTLAEVLDLIGNRLTINIELKGFSRDKKQLPAAVLALVADFGLEESVIYSSFNPRMLVHLHRIDRQAKAGLLLPPGGLDTYVRAVFSPIVHPWSLHPHFSSVNERLIRQAQRFGRSVITWTVNQKEDMQRMIALGVDGIITDIPLLAQKVREELL